MSKLNNLRPWYAEEIYRILKSIAMIAAHGNHSKEFIDGFKECLNAICTALDINESDLK